MNHIREALWDDTTNGAVVLVGAGFSRNAERRPPATGDPPLWTDIGHAMQRRLSREFGHGAVRGKPGRSLSIPRTAQEYEAAFGRAELYRFLRSAVRDDDFLPGPLHYNLLELPWRDVFTTNWDTLLERTNNRLSGRHYRVVNRVEDIPLSKAPRIVKLHGSVPSQFPLICTEEHYRRYPADFAAFVNMVQQAMLESVLCLIGFSGDDPNFLQWHGWVRDNLGSHAWKLYLVGWQNLTPHRRQMLEDRNVIPIDLARHPKASQWPEHLRGRYATEWVVRTLEHGRPYDLTEWPEPPPEPSKIPTLLLPVSTIVSRSPVADPWHSFPKAASEASRRDIENTLETWCRNRSIYPGWLVLPSSQRHSLTSATDHWEESILRTTETDSFAKRLSAVYEIVWRRSILMDPPSKELQHACERLVDEEVPTSLFATGIHDSDGRLPTLWNQWCSLVFFLLRAARLRFDQTGFDRLLALLDPFRSEDPHVGHTRQFERALWTAYSLDHKAMASLLDEWSTEDADPVWSMRKASLLLELHHENAAESLLRRTLEILRTGANSSRRFANSSREGWLLWSLLGNAYRHNGHEAPGIWRRWRELGRIHCDAGLEKSFFMNALRPEKQSLEATPFDLDRTVLSGESWSTAKYERWRAAHRAVRLCEVAGLAPTAWDFRVGSDLMNAALEVMESDEPELAARLCLRITTYDRDKSFDRVFGRVRVAAMSKRVVGDLKAMCERSLAFYDRSVGSAEDRGVVASERVRVAMECLSRLAVRLEPEAAHSVLMDGLQRYSRPEYAKHPFHDAPMSNLLSRSWEALAANEQKGVVLKLLNAPILGLDGFVGTFRYPDPCDGVWADWKPPERTTGIQEEWGAAAELIVRGLRADEIARRRAIHRAYLLNAWRRFTPEEEEKVANALWRPKGRMVKGLPEAKGIPMWTFVYLPEPDPGLALRRFWKVWKRLSATSDTPALDAFQEVNGVLSNFQNADRSVSMPEAARREFVAKVETWAKSTDEIVTVFRDNFGESLRINQVRALCGIFLHVSVPERTADLLFEKVKAMNESTVSGLPLVIGILSGRPDYGNDMNTMIHTSLASDSRECAEGAVWGIYHWARGAATAPDRVPAVPEELVQEIGHIVAIRRRHVLRPALDIACWFVKEGPEVLRDRVALLAIQGLGFLLEELRYDRIGGDESDVPVLRRNCARLALALANRGWDSEEVVRAWVAECEADPLPEVRFAEA